jgi:hypothetical protein
MSNNQESSLTTPQDRDITNPWKPDQSIGPLSNDEAKEALRELNITSFTDKFPKVDRTYQDPAIPMQNYGLISFIPAKGASPNEKGIYGFAKLRGNFATEMESNQRAEYIIRNVDSYHQIFHTYVGRPFPLTTSSDYSAVTEEIDIRKETTSTISNSIKEKKEIEQRQIQEIKEREEKLLKESKQETADPYEEYITQRVKKAQLIFTYLEHEKKMKEIKEILIKTRKVIETMDEEHPDFQVSYFEKYKKAREEAGIKEDAKETENNFIKYMIEDVDLGF